MQCKAQSDSFGRFLFTATTGEYDGYPQIAQIFVDSPPVKINQYRSALACSLPFIGKVNGPLDTDTPWYPLTSSLVREWAPFDAYPTNIKWEPADIADGSGVLVISAGVAPSLVAGRIFDGDEDVAELRLVQADSFHGSLATTRSCVLGSNLWLVKRLDGISAFIQSLVAVGVVFAEDYDARRLIVAVDEIPPSFDVLGMSRLVESVGLQLMIIEVPGDAIS